MKKVYLDYDKLMIRLLTLAKDYGMTGHKCLMKHDDIGYARGQSRADAINALIQEIDNKIFDVKDIEK